jgi:hypothetical protein
MPNEWNEIGMKRGFAAGEVDDHELVVVQKPKQAHAVVYWKVGWV